MKVILFGATGMVGQGVLRECLARNDVTSLISVGRRSTAITDSKLVDLVLPDLFDLSTIRSELSGSDACFFCLGVSALGMSEDAYRRITLDLTLSVAKTLVEIAPGMTFVYVSGSGTDSSEQGSVMWARVKGATENRLLELPFKAAYMFRPAFIQPLHGIRSRTTAYRVFYALTRPVAPLLLRLFPAWTTTTDVVARAMLCVADEGWTSPVVENRDINTLGTDRKES